MKGSGAYIFDILNWSYHVNDNQLAINKNKLQGYGMFKSLKQCHPDVTTFNGTVIHKYMHSVAAFKMLKLSSCMITVIT